MVNWILGMLILKRTNSFDPDFQQLVRELDIELKERDGEEHLFYSQFNKTDNIRYVIVAYENDKPVGCGAIKEYAEEMIEVKRMFVRLNKRGKGIASELLNELERWSRDLGYTKCILETGKKNLKLYVSTKRIIILLFLITDSIKILKTASVSKRI